VRLSQKTARQRRQSHFSATVWTGFNVLKWFARRRHVNVSLSRWWSRLLQCVDVQRAPILAVINRLFSFTYTWPMHWRR